MANVKQKMPSGNAGKKSTNPPATMGKASPITNNSQVSDAKQNARQGFKSHDPARGNTRNGDFSQ